MIFSIVGVVIVIGVGIGDCMYVYFSYWRVKDKSWFIIVVVYIGVVVEAFGRCFII